MPIYCDSHRRISPQGMEMYKDPSQQFYFIPFLIQHEVLILPYLGDSFFFFCPSGSSFTDSWIIIHISIQHHSGLFGIQSLYNCGRQRTSGFGNGQCQGSKLVRLLISWSYVQQSLISLSTGHNVLVEITRPSLLMVKQ